MYICQNVLDGHICNAYALPKFYSRHFKWLTYFFERSIQAISLTSISPFTLMSQSHFVCLHLELKFSKALCHIHLKPHSFSWHLSKRTLDNFKTTRFELWSPKTTSKTSLRKPHCFYKNHSPKNNLLLPFACSQQAQR